MQVRPDLSAVDLFELGVVDDAQEWLEEESDKHDDADDGVVACAGVCDLVFVSLAHVFK